MQKRKKLASKIIAMASVIFIVLLAVNVLLMVYNSKQSVEATIGERTITVAENILNYIDIEKYEELVKNPVENDLYWELREQLNELREMNGVLYAYTYAVPNEGEGITFLVDGMPIDDTENAASLGEESSATKYEHLQKALEDGGYASDLLEGSYGEFISGFIPMKNASGEVVAFLGVDIDASYVEEISGEIAKQLLPGMIAIFMVIILAALGFLFYYINSFIFKTTDRLNYCIRAIS